MEKRPYRQTRRAKAAAATRQRIVAAARDKMMSGESFTIEAVAARAEVSRVTVYAQFGGRDALREAVFDDLAATGGLAEIPAAFAEADPMEALGRVVDIFCRFYATHRAVLRRLNALAALAEGESPPDRNERRRQIFITILSRAAQLPAHQGLDVETAAGTLQALTSFEFYDRLAGDAADIDPARCIRNLISALLHGRSVA
jgi:AcrR family transcriptional regulator